MLKMNPFTLGIAKSEMFCDRETECKDLVNYARNGHNVVLVSPRRLGKTSLVAHVQKDLKKEGLLVVYTDFPPMATEKDFVQKFSTAVFEGMGSGVDPRSFVKKIGNFFRHLVPTGEITQEGFRTSVRYDPAIKTDLLLEDLLDGMYAYVKKKKMRASVALDEFQEIVDLPESRKLEGILRSKMQFHNEISYFYIGSRSRVLLDMFSKARPFYKSAFTYELREIPREIMARCVVDRFMDSGKSLSLESAFEMYDWVRGNTYYVQKMASIAWEIADKECDISCARKALSILLRLESTEFEAVWRGLTHVQRIMLKALALGPVTSLYGRDFLDRGLTSGAVQKASKVLLERDLIEEHLQQKKFRISDPVMEAWLKHS